MCCILILVVSVVNMWVVLTINKGMLMWMARWVRFFIAVTFLCSIIQRSSD